MHTFAPRPAAPDPHRGIGPVPPGPGTPLEAGARREMEGRFGRDFGGVRVHAGTPAGRARAATVGEEIAFAPGRYRPGTADGRRLLAHELTHVVQQRLGGPAPFAGSEREAERVADAVPGRGPLPPIMRGTAVGAAFAPGDDVEIGDDPGMTAAHAGGAMGERDAAFALGQRGFEIVLGPGGAGGHQLTEPGLDIVGYHPQRDETWVIDNKASGGRSTVQSASAITTNLEQNLRTAIAQIRTFPAFPHQARVVQHLEDALRAVAAGTPLPSSVKLRITPAGGYHSGISRRLQQQGIGFEDLTGAAVRDARKQDIARAKSAGVKSGRPVTRAAPAAAEPDAVVRVPAPALSTLDEPSGAGAEPEPAVTSGTTGSNVRAGVAAGVVTVATEVATLYLNQWLQEHFAEYRREGIREFTDEALEKASPRFAEVIGKNRAEIRKAQARGRHVYLDVVVKVRMVDSTDRDPLVGSGLGIGDVAFGSDVERVQVYYEGDPEPAPFRADTWLVGDFFRAMVGYSARYRTVRRPIGGTDEDVRHRNEVIRDVEAMMTDPGRPFEFERLLVKSQSGGPPAGLLREYAGFKRELSAASPFARDRREAGYWARMGALTDAPLAEVITQAKVALVPLGELRQYAIEQRVTEKLYRNEEAEARWTAVIQLIDAPLDERLLAEQQRNAWKRGPSDREAGDQASKVAALGRRKGEVERQIAQLGATDARTADERRGGEPPHPPWSRINELKDQLKALTRELDVESRLLRDMRNR